MKQCNVQLGVWPWLPLQLCKDGLIDELWSFIWASLRLTCCSSCTADALVVLFIAGGEAVIR